MNRSLKQFLFGSVYLIIFILMASGLYFLYFKPAPSCTDNKQNQKETGIDCGGPCIPCQLKNLKLVTEEIKFFPAGKDQATLLAKVRNPSQNFSANLSYQFELAGAIPNQWRAIRGKTVIAPQTAQYVVVPGLPLSTEDIKDINLNITELSWEKKPPLTRDIQVVRQTNIDQNRVTVTGTLSNRSAVSLPTLNLTVLLFDSQGELLNVSMTELEPIPAFSQKQFTIFFPEVEGLAQKLDSEKTEIQLGLDE